MNSSDIKKLPHEGNTITVSIKEGIQLIDNHKDKYFIYIYDKYVSVYSYLPNSPLADNGTIKYDNCSVLIRSKRTYIIDSTGYRKAVFNTANCNILITKY